MAATRHDSVTNTLHITTANVRPPQTSTPASRDSSSNASQQATSRRSSFLMTFLRSMSACVA